jgi:ABC-type glycerol-3-phosphate transport system substrate-binding protein
LPQTRDLPFRVAVGPVPGEEGPVSELSDDAIVVFRRYADAKFEAISAFLDYLTGPALQGADALALGSVPVRASVAESVIVPDELAAAYGVARATPLVPAWGRIEAGLDRYLGLAYAWQGPDGAKPAP